MSGSDGFDLDGFLARELPPVDAALDRAVARWRSELPVELVDAMAHGVLSGGKRLRPILCVAAYRACGGGSGADEGVYDLAASLELIHAYSLMHDDLPCMDDAPLRRGIPTTHRLHGVRPTTVAGAALIPLAALQALRGARALSVAEPVARRLAELLLAAAGAGGMVGGQALDLLGEGRVLTPDELDELHRLKTGALLAAAPRMGGLAAGASEDVQDALDAYGRALGLAFQIADDLLDATATAEVLGKQPSDTELEKSTYVRSHGLAEARRRGREQVRRAVFALDAVALDAPALRALASYALARAR